MAQWRNPLAELQERLSGVVCTPGTADYKDELTLFNPCLRHEPALVIGAANANDVCTAVSYAADRGLGVAVLNTGHGPSLAADDKTLVITTRRLGGSYLDPVRRTARVGAGVRFGQLVQAAAQHGLAPLTGSSPGVGVIGYTLGGGASPTIGRKFGWAADHVSAMDVVTADGRLRHVSAERDGDLFAALLGGKSNFGVVTAMECALFPVGRLYAGSLFFAGQHARPVLNTYREFAMTAPDEITTSAAVLHLPPLPGVPDFMQAGPVVAIRVSFIGDPDSGRQLIEPLRAAAPLLADTVSEIPYAEFAGIFGDPGEPAAAIEHFGLLRELTDDTVDAIVGQVGRGSTIIDLRQLGGAFIKPAPVPCAVGIREAPFAMFELTVVPPGADVHPYRERGSALMHAVAPWLHANGHPSFQGPADATDAGVRRAYESAVYAKLQVAKRKYDPENIFRVNHNIAPLPDA